MERRVLGAGRFLSWAPLLVIAGLVGGCGGAASDVSNGPGFAILHHFNGADGARPRGSLVRDLRGTLYGTASSGGFSWPEPRPGTLGGWGVVFALDRDGAYRVLHNFQGSDGAEPNGSLLFGAGHLYGTTSRGGSANAGVIFELARDGTYRVLHSFSGPDGSSPNGSLVEDGEGNLYGTTEKGGTSDAGVVFKLAPDGRLTVLHSFGSGSDGTNPAAGLVRDAGGNLFGTTFYGGRYGRVYTGPPSPGCCPDTGPGWGVLFKLAANGAYTVRHNFNGSDGSNPAGELILDGSDNLYGTAQRAGYESIGSSYYGAIFRLAPDDTATLLFGFLGGNFSVGSDGGAPVGRLAADPEGNLYGTVSEGWGSFGAVFKLAPDGTYTMLHGFGGSWPSAKGKMADGATPLGGPILDAEGNLYGTTSEGGAYGSGRFGGGWGIVYRLAAADSPN